jgi:arabinogalactan oligomer/maltooligosaccharide transport system permease protein
MVACYAGLAFAACRAHGYAAGDRLKQILLCLPLFVVESMAFSKVFLKQDDKLLRSLPGYVPEEHYRGPKRAFFLALELFTLSLIIQLTITPMVTSQYLKWYGNTLTIALFTAVIQTAIVLSVSYALSRLRFRGRKLIMNAVLVLGLFPGFLTMITLYFLLKQMGLTQAGAVPGLILIYCASSGMGYYISKGFFDTIPKSLDESARIDGATRFQVFLKIIMPLAKPIVIYTVLMAFMAPWGDYVFASYVAFGHQEGYNVAVGLYNWVNTNDFQNYFTRFCAGGVLVAVPITALFMALQKYYVEGVTGGAVKG